MSKKKKSINRRSPSPSSSPEMNVNLELDIKALRGKNKQLIQAVAKLQQEKAVQLTQMTTLQEEFFKLNSKYVNLKNIFSTIDATTKVCFPKQLELVNTFGKIMQLCAVGATVSNLNKDPKTQAVKPHNVNGHVLQNPTITLSRFNDSDSVTPPRRSSGRNPANNSAGNDLQPSPVRRSNNLNSSHVNSRPSTSRVPISNDSRSAQETNMDDANLADMVQELEPVVTRTVNLARLNMSNMSEDVEEGVDTPEEDEDISDPDYHGRLVTIQEEEEEAYNSTLRSINTSQTAFSDRVREIRIFLDPLPTDCIGRSENIEHFVNRTSSLVGEPSTSVLDPNNTLLNDSLSSPEDTMKFITSARGSRNFSFKTSPTKNNSSFFGEASCSSGRVDEDVNKIQVLRGQYHKAAADVSQKFEYESTASMSLQDDSSVILPVKLGSITNCFSNISAINNLGSENTFNESTSVELNNSKVNTMKSLGLEPKNLRLTTSTPVVVKSPRTSSRIKKLSIPLNSSKKKSPVDSKVTKRRGGSDDKKMAQVIVKRLSLERRLSSGSPIKKIGELLSTPPITKASQMRKGRPKVTKQKPQNSESNVDSASSEQEVTPESNRKKNVRSKTVKGKTKGKENRHSPRPKRAAKPTQLKEPSLHKKMRRSR